nr:uncharacterized protein LOC122272331 [Parasteatoda tepidariorum]
MSKNGSKAVLPASVQRYTGIQKHPLVHSPYLMQDLLTHTHRPDRSLASEKVHCLTIIDRYTRWPEVIPLADMVAETVCRALFHGWISRFGCPATITKDQGRQFESSLFKELTRFIGTNRIRTTSFHPQSNGLIERFHRVLKNSIKAQENVKWTETIPVILLGLRAAVKPDIKVSSAELVYGMPLRLPAEICSDTPSVPCDYPFVQQLREKMSSMRPTPTSAHGQHKIFVHPKLKDCTHVFLRVDKIVPPLTQPYTGPHEVLSRTDKHITIQKNGKETCVSLDRVKPAFIFNDLISETNDSVIGSSTSDFPIVPTTSTSDFPSLPSRQLTKSGRRVRFPKRLITE